MQYQTRDWDHDQIDAHISFGWNVLDEEEQTAMSFIIDHASFQTFIRQSVRDMNMLSSRRCFDIIKIIEKKWIAHINAEELEKSCITIKGDLRNMPLLVISFGLVFCNPSTFDSVKYVHDYYGNLLSDCDDVLDAILHRRRAIMDGIDAMAVRLSFEYFTTPKSVPDQGHHTLKSGAHWFYTILQSGALYLPVQKTQFNSSQVKYNHVATAVFFNHGWSHRFYCLPYKMTHCL